jgi:hypothetical protein
VIRGAALAAALGAAACARHAIRVPDHVQGYEIIVSGRDSLTQALARALVAEGFHVRREVRGGTRPAAVLVHFIFRENRSSQAFLYGRLADTRTGAVMAAAEIALDTGRLAARDSIPALIRALSKRP